MLDTIVQISGVSPKHWNDFEATSPGGIPFAGYVCRQESDWLGALAVTRLAEEERLEFIPAMPKIPYPYQRHPDGARLVIPVPQGVVDARFNLKLDGTCIIFYPLKAKDGRVLEVLPRTRLQPVLAASRWGDWPARLAQAQPDLEPLKGAVRAQDVVLAFELWGYRNPHLVHYDTPLALTLHTVIRGRKIASYRLLADLAHRYGLNLIPSMEVVAPNVEALTLAYRRWQEEMERRNTAAGAGEFVEEGAILMLSTARTATYFKCKPPSIEEIHFAAEQTINKEIIRQALLKLLEAGHDPGVDNRVEPLLAELEKDFDPVEVTGQRELVERVWQEFLIEQARQEWLKQLVTQSGIDADDRVTLLRHLSAHYPKKEMSWVYSTLKVLYG